MSRRRRTILLALGLLVVAVFITLEHTSISRKWRLEPKTPKQKQAYDFKKYHAKTFTVVNVVDGDTIDINIPDGEYEHTRIRLWGIDAPETRNNMYFGREAAEFAEKLALGKQVTVYLDERNRTRGYYGRLLAYIQLPDKRFLNEVLLQEGYAYADLRFRHSFYNKYKKLEAVARSQKRGLWKNITPEQMPQWRQKEK